MLWIKGAQSTKNFMVDSGLVKKLDISENTGNTRQFSEIDKNEYLSYKGESDEASRGQLQQGLKCIAPIKSLLNNGKVLIAKLWITRGKLTEIKSVIAAATSKRRDRYFSGSGALNLCVSIGI